jgi:hypothetical protein
MWRGKQRGWQGAVAHVAMIALLLRAVLLPAGCFVSLAAAASADDGAVSDSAAVQICTLHGGQDAGGSADPDAGSGKKSHHTSPACASACCTVAVPAAVAVFNPPSAGLPAFNIESWRTPAGAASLALRNRGPPSTLSV